MMISSIIVTAISLSRMLATYSPQALQSAFYVVGIVALIMGLFGLVKLEPRSSSSRPPSGEYSWGRLMRVVFSNRQATLFFVYLVILLAAILGQDVLLEPYGAEAFNLSVQQTTRITSIWGVCVLAALVVAGILEGRASKRRVAQWGAWGAFAGFMLIAISGWIANLGAFYTGVVFLGIGTGLSTVSNLSLMLDMTTAGNVGLYIGAWGMANAISRLLGSIMGGAARDGISQFAQSPITGYLVVFGFAAGLMLISLWMLGRIDVRVFQRRAEQQMTVVERIAAANDA
jgi:BCD family chlorophyll transporter-like MFS transporter